MKGNRAEGKRMIRRFSRLRIFEHWGIVLSTLILFATGLSQRFWHLDFSQWLILKMGGSTTSGGSTGMRGSSSPSG